MECVVESELSQFSYNKMLLTTHVYIVLQWVSQRCDDVDADVIADWLCFDTRPDLGSDDAHICDTM